MSDVSKKPSIAKIISASDGKIFPLGNNIFRIGRGEENDIVIPSQSTSYYHAEVLKKDNRYFLRDIQSLNGTFVNKKRVLNATCFLKHGDTLRFGLSKLTFVFYDSNRPQKKPPSTPKEKNMSLQQEKIKRAQLREEHAKRRDILKKKIQDDRKIGKGEEDVSSITFPYSKGMITLPLDYEWDNDENKNDEERHKKNLHHHRKSHDPSEGMKRRDQELSDDEDEETPDFWPEHEKRMRSENSDERGRTDNKGSFENIDDDVDDEFSDDLEEEEEGEEEEEEEGSDVNSNDDEFPVIIDKEEEEEEENQNKRKHKHDEDEKSNLNNNNNTPKKRDRSIIGLPQHEPKSPDSDHRELEIHKKKKKKKLIVSEDLDDNSKEKENKGYQSRYSQLMSQVRKNKDLSVLNEEKLNRLSQSFSTSQKISSEVEDNTNNDSKKKKKKKKKMEEEESDSDDSESSSSSSEESSSGSDEEDGGRRRRRRKKKNKKRKDGKKKKKHTNLRIDDEDVNSLFSLAHNIKNQMLLRGSNNNNNQSRGRMDDPYNHSLNSSSSSQLFNSSRIGTGTGFLGRSSRKKRFKGSHEKSMMMEETKKTLRWIDHNLQHQQQQQQPTQTEFSGRTKKQQPKKQQKLHHHRYQQNNYVENVDDDDEHDEDEDELSLILNNNKKKKKQEQEQERKKLMNETKKKMSMMNITKNFDDLEKKGLRRRIIFLEKSVQSMRSEIHHLKQEKKELEEDVDEEGHQEEERKRLEKHYLQKIDFLNQRIHQLHTQIISSNNNNNNNKKKNKRNRRKDENEDMNNFLKMKLREIEVLRRENDQWRRSHRQESLSWMELMEQNEKLKRSNRQLEEIVQRQNNDLRNILTSKDRKLDVLRRSQFKVVGGSLFPKQKKKEEDQEDDEEDEYIDFYEQQKEKEKAFHFLIREVEVLEKENREFQMDVNSKQLMIDELRSNQQEMKIEINQMKDLLSVTSVQSEKSEVEEREESEKPTKVVATSILELMEMNKKLKNKVKSLQLRSCPAPMGLLESKCEGLARRMRDEKKYSKKLEKSLKKFYLIKKNRKLVETVSTANTISFLESEIQKLKSNKKRTTRRRRRRRNDEDEDDMSLLGSSSDVISDVGSENFHDTINRKVDNDDDDAKSTTSSLFFDRSGMREEKGGYDDDEEDGNISMKGRLKTIFDDTDSVEQELMSKLFRRRNEQIRHKKEQTLMMMMMTKDDEGKEQKQERSKGMKKKERSQRKKKNDLNRSSMQDGLLLDSLVEL